MTDDFSPDYNPIYGLYSNDDGYLQDQRVGKWECSFCHEVMSSEKFDANTLELTHYEFHPDCLKRMQGKEASEKEIVEREKRIYECEFCKAEIYGYERYMLHRMKHSTEKIAKSNDEDSNLKKIDELKNQLLEEQLKVSKKEIITQKTKLLMILRIKNSCMSWTQLRDEYQKFFGNITDASLSRALGQLLTDNQIAKSDEGYSIGKETN